MGISAEPTSLPGVQTETWLLRFAKDGTCESPETKVALLERLRSAPKAPVILFSHGWNNEYGHALLLYAGLLAQLEAHRAAHADESPAPIFIGVLWPSTWLSFDRGPAMAAVAKDTRAESYGDELGAALPEDQRTRFSTLMGAARLTEEQVAELAALTASAIAANSGTGAAEGAEPYAPLPADVAAAMKAVQAMLRPPSSDGGDDLPEGGTAGGAVPGAPQDAGILSWLDPRSALRIASVYQMKDRAGTVGTAGVGPLLAEVLAATPAPVHLVGHSYGAKVVLSALAAAAAPRKAASALLLQPAVSHLCFAEAVPGRQGTGGYHDVPARIDGSVALTYSAWDFPLHEVFHHALRRAADLGEVRIAGAEGETAGQPPNPYAALGGYGPRAANESLTAELPAPGTPLPQLRTHGLFGFDGTRDRRVASHGDVTTPHAAWLLYQQMRD